MLRAIDNTHLDLKFLAIGDTAVGKVRNLFRIILNYFSLIDMFIKSIY
jgi:hypothetical protein